MKRRNLFKKSLSVLLGMALVIAVLATGTIGSVQAEAATSGTCGDDLTWSLDNEGTFKALTISGTGAMEDYSTGSSPWYSNRGSIISVDIGNEVTTIGASAFEGCSLMSIEIPKSVTIIGDHAFADCRSIRSITIPDGVTKIGAFAFSGSNILESITIPESVITIGDSAFYGCASLTSIEIPESVTKIGDSVFSECFDLTSITIPGSVEKIGDSAFSYCSSLTSIEIPESVTKIGDSAFSYCSSLESITIPESVTTIGGAAFENCTSLETIYLPSGATIGSSAIPDTAWQITYEVDEENQTTRITEITKGSGSMSDSITIPETIGDYPVASVGEDYRTYVGEHTHYGGAATCTEGSTCAICGAPLGDSLGHAYGAPEFEWADDYSTCTAVFTCEHDSSHVEREACVITSETTKKATTTAEGELTYTATVEFEGVSYTDTKTKAIAKLPSGGGSAPVSSTTPEQTNTAPEPDSSTVVTVNEDGTTSETTGETVTNEAGNEVEVTTVVYKDADGNVTGSEVVSVIPEADRNTSATITVTRDAQEYVTDASAEVTTVRIAKTAGVVGAVSGNVVSQITEAAGVEAVEITVNVTGVKGKTKYTVTVDSADLKAGNELRAVAIDPETGEYLLVNARTYTVTQEGGIEVSLHSGRVYVLVTAEKAAAIEAAILKTIKVEKASATLKVGKTTYIRLSSALNMTNVKKITYASGNKKIATVDKNGKITAKKAGAATVKAKVTLKSGASKTVKMKIKVKNKTGNPLFWLQQLYLRS